MADFLHLLGKHGIPLYILPEHIRKPMVDRFVEILRENGEQEDDDDQETGLASKTQ